MKATNIGIVKAVISKKMSNDFLTEGKINKSKNDVSNFLNIVKTSPLLQLEHQVFDRLENKTINNDVAATRYIDGNLGLFESYSQENINEEHIKIKNFLDETVMLIEDKKYKLYVAIGNLIYETLNKTNPNVDLIHDSFTTVLNHIKKDKIIKEEKLIEIPKEINSDKLIEVALNKFTEKYNVLEQSDMKLIKTLIMSEDNDKKSLFESLKSENISLLEESEKNGMEDKIHKTIDKIKNMEYSDDSSIKGIISLHQLKKDLV
jgi:hypothetical protein